MAERRVTFQVDIDLTKGSKQAHARTVGRIAEALANLAVDEMEQSGYTIRRADSQTTMHYVRHTIKHAIRTPKRLRVVRDKTAS